MAPVPLCDQVRDSSYGRLLRHLDQAMDMARTREWLSGEPLAQAMLELNGLSPDDQRLLWRIIEELPLSLPLRIAPPPEQGTGRQTD
ncbi:MAG: hypothetical protein ACK4VV_15915 [Pseudomonas sp.]